MRLAWIFSLLPTPNISLLHCNPIFLLIHPFPLCLPFFLQINVICPPFHSFHSFSYSHIICNPCIQSYTPSYLFTLTNFFHTDLMLLPTQYFFCSQSILLLFYISFSLPSSLFCHYFLYLVYLFIF